MKVKPKERHVARLERGLYNVVEVAELLGISYKVLAKNVRNGTIPRPARQFLGSRRKYYNQKEINRIGAYFLFSQVNSY